MVSGTGSNSTFPLCASAIISLAPAIHLTDFQNKIPVVEFIPEGSTVFSGWRFVLKDSDLLPDRFASLLMPEGSNANLEINISDYRVIDLGILCIPSEVRRAFCSVFQSILFEDNIESIVNNITADWKHDVISVHVRTWQDDEFRREHFHDFHGFVREIDRRDPRMRIFLATDSCDVLEYFKRRYRGRVLSIPTEMPTFEPQISNYTNDYAIAFSDMICLLKVC
jgi:hypothetical protein